MFRILYWFYLGPSCLLRTKIGRAIAIWSYSVFRSAIASVLRSPIGVLSVLTLGWMCNHIRNKNVTLKNVRLNVRCHCLHLLKLKNKKPRMCRHCSSILNVHPQTFFDDIYLKIANFTLSEPDKIWWVLTRTLQFVRIRLLYLWNVLE